MAESVILGSPTLVCTLTFAFLMQCIFRHIGIRQAPLQLLPAAVCAVSLVYAVLFGASLEELSLVLCIFFAQCLTGCGRKEK